ncbi:MAG: hypothetical protein KAH12_00130, partial [Anaerolineales bacterium]|nr:hypothetical protein [Anaerolineales bacterium]
FDGEDYTGFNGVSDAGGEVVFTLPEGDYRFRADLNDVQFWSGEVDHCALPGCEAAIVEIPGAFGVTEVTIDYTYDPLYRLTAADYDDDDGTFFHFTYDAVGNRLTQDTLAGTNAYVYDIANRLTSMDGVNYTWDNNGNLLTDGTSVYTYNYANMLAGVNQGGVDYTYAYNGLGDRLQQAIDGVPTNYTLDTNTGLTQVLTDGTHTYLYGLGRIAQEGTEVEYFLGDALNSVRQLVDSSAGVTLTQSYEPFGSVLSSVEGEESIFNFTGEIKDSYIKLLYLRSRYMSVDTGRFLTKDVWDGDYTTPMSYNAWLYVNGNPVNFTDPSGKIPDQQDYDSSISPCDIDSSLRFCIFRGGRYKGFFIDMDHFRGSKTRANVILDKLRNNKGNEITFPVEGTLIGISYNRLYQAFLPDNASPSVIENEGLGILLNYETNLEKLESIYPSCLLNPWGIFPHRCSAFSNEDLPSAYLGYAFRAKGKDFNWLLSELDGNNENSYMSDVFPSDYAGTVRDARRCVFGFCDENNPYNRCFNPKVLDALEDNYVYLPWPADLNDITPTSDYWRVVKSEIRR